MTRLPVSALLLGTAGATLALTFACGGGTTDPGTGGTSGTSPSVGGAAAMAGTPSTSGSAGQSPTGGTGGATPMGGSSGTGAGTGGSTGGANPMGGNSGAGIAAGAGMAGTGSAGSPAGGSAGLDAGGMGGTGATTDCMVMGMATETDIGTVFNVAVTTDLAGFDGGQIDFGVDTNYGYTAPIDMAAGKTMLLGMKQSTDYHYRVTVKAGAMTCVGADQTLTTGGLLTGFPRATISPTTTPATSAGGFMISEYYAGMRQVPFILDKDLDLVWTYDWKIGQPTRARMSMDGKYMWVARANVPDQTAGMKKIAMDGSSEEDLSSKFPRMNHDFTIIDDADQTMYFIAYAASGSCDDIVEYNPKTGANRTVMNTSAAFSDGAACHCNAIDYSPMDDTLIVSDLDHHALIKVDRKTGATKWVLNGCSQNDFTGEGSSWTGPEHNFHILGPDHILLFNNVVGMGSMSGACPVGNSGSLALEIKLDEGAKTATKMWSYSAMPAVQNIVMGDVQRLPNGNTMVAYSTQGVVHEVDAMSQLIRSISWGTGGAIGYIIMRPTLYGKSPR
jgi:hypothetical protein